MKIDFTYRKPEERRRSEPKPAPPEGTYYAKIYNVSEWTNKNTGKTALFVNLEIGKEYEFGVKFNLYSDKDSQREYAQYAFSELLDACNIDGATFQDTDVLIGKVLTVTLENGVYGLQATRFERQDPNRRVDTPPPASRYQNEPQESQFNYDKRPGFIDTVDNSNDEPPF